MRFPTFRQLAGLLGLTANPLPRYTRHNKRERIVLLQRPNPLRRARNRFIRAGALTTIIVFGNHHHRTFFARP